MNLQLVDRLLEVNLADLASHDLNHLFADASTLRGLGVGCLFDLVRLTLCESNAKYTKVETIGCLHIYVGLYQSLPGKVRFDADYVLSVYVMYTIYVYV